MHADRQVILGAQDGCGAGEVLRGHADNGEVLPVDADGLREDVAIESRSLPDLIAGDHRARRRARAFLVHRKVAAVDRLHAERLEEARGDDVDRRLTGRVVLGDAGDDDRVTREVRERSARVSQIGKAWIGEGAIAALGRTVFAEHADDFTRRVGPGEGPDHQAVDDAEDAGVDADAERQDAHGGQGEAGMLEEKASAVSKILPGGPHPGPDGRSLRDVPLRAQFERRSISSSRYARMAARTGAGTRRGQRQPRKAEPYRPHPAWDAIVSFEHSAAG